MAKIPSLEEIARRFEPVTEADLGPTVEATDTLLKSALERISEERASDAHMCFDLVADLEVIKDLPEIPLPRGIATQIAKRVESGSRFVEGQSPEPGKIVELYPDVHGEPVALAQEPIPVLLDVLEASGKTWRGWIVARDRGYASCWDLILGPEEDDRDPLCEIVQVWNPVRINSPKDCRILGQLSPHRLAAVRTLAVDHENGFISGPRDEHRLGVAVARELSDGIGVVTGTSIAGEDDPRIAYQKIYRAIAARLPQPAPTISSAAPRVSQSSLWQRLLGLPAWQLGGAVATLLLAPLVVLLVMQAQPDAPPTLPQATHHYAGTGEVQQLRVADPEASAREIIAALREIGALPDTRSAWAGMVSIRADLTGVPAADQGRVLARFKLKLPPDGMLKVDLIRNDILPSADGAKDPGK